MLQALEDNWGNVTIASKVSRVDRNSHYKWMNSDPKYKAAVTAIFESTLDLAEDQLKKNILSGKETSLIFYLKCKGKARGYIDTVQIDGSIQHDVRQVQVIVNSEETKQLLNDVMNKLADNNMLSLESGTTIKNLDTNLE